MLSASEANTLHIMAKLQNLAKHMERYGAEPLSTHRANPVGAHNIEAWNNYALKIIYDDKTIDEDNEDHVVYERVPPDAAFPYKDMQVMYTTPTDGSEGFLSKNPHNTPTSAAKPQVVG